MQIVSGGQTGADRAALDIALELGFESGGWVPLGRQAEDGKIPDRYPNLRETDSPLPAVRTELNVRDSDATLIVSHGTLVGGTALTRAALSILPATTTGLSLVWHTARINSGTSPLNR